MKRNTKIVCTLGPACARRKILAKMAERGMDVARLNFSHGDHAQHLKMIRSVRAINKQTKSQVKILQDLEGYRIRVGHFAEPKVLEKGRIFYMANESRRASNHIPFDYQGDIRDIKKEMDIFIDDGTIALKVVGLVGKRLKCCVVQPGVLQKRKGINIPQLKLQSNILTEKDQNDLQFGIEQRVDFVAQSFVRNKKDITRVAKIVKSQNPQCQIIAKIENKEGVRNINGIIDACDGIMVARGDLGVALPIYKIPILQKHIIRRCIRKKKFVITATQMLESMTEHYRPTRAEVSDVANAILDGTDYVMLSAETAAGRYPSRSVQMMTQIIDYTENYENAHL